ncbi:putative polysaccharide pyruvyl transferase [Hyella patelloides LEGE 07179]|uniref:Putative polysaccharide pyruvyl transferase n=1 Tax=Hyella patelloides LEGE 07179 TaxID=945734 RepID=A0A563VQZ1_9CYAN|nr:polysaccharide pyruvyl transferase family protein [Hyella patelloides]VEP13843.1 putative polysaccharide pyruvyl transferase [Hyella patelloides LEGE 07179]
MKAIITGVTGFRNRGVEALVKTTVEQLLRRNPQLNIDILTETPDYDRIRLPQEKVNLVDIKSYYQGWLQKLQAKSSKFNKSLAPEYTLFKEASVVIASGGDLFTSDYGGLRYHLRPLNLALHARVPVVFLGQSIAFKTNEEAQTWLKVAHLSKLITVREGVSYKYLTKDLELPTDLVKHTADSAFLLEPPPSEDIANLLQSYGLTEEFPIVAIAPSQGISRYSGLSEKQHIETWHQVIKMILDEFNAQVLLIPHSQNLRPNNDDRIIATNIYRSFRFEPRIHLAGADHSASEFKGLISACDMLIAERMHAAIAGISSSVCTMVIGYSVKAEGIMTDVLEAESVHNRLLISIKQFLDADLACSKLRTAWKCRDEVSSQLKEALPRVKKDAASNFDLIGQILK